MTDRFTLLVLLSRSELRAASPKGVPARVSASKPLAMKRTWLLVTPVTKGQVRFIANGLEADTLAGTPFGDAARNSLRDNKTNNVNLSVIKNFKFWERASVQLHLDLLNAFNHVQFGSIPNGIDPFVDDAGLQSQGTGFANPAVQSSTARSIRIGLKILF